jgi:MFS transporter, FSR family, fosmidomycin resistance protein
MKEEFASPVFTFACLGHAYAHLFMLIYPTVVLALGPEFDMTYGNLISLSLPGFILFGVGALPAGWLGDRWSTRGMLAIQFLGLGVAAVVTGLAQSAAHLAIGLGAIGLFASIYHPVGIAVVIRYGKKRGRALGINGVFGSVGTAGAAVIAGALTDFMGWRAAFLIPGTIGIATGLAFLFFVKNIPPARTGEEARGSGGNGLRVVLFAFAVFLVISSCQGFVYQSLAVGLPKIFAERLEFLAGEVSGVGGLVSLVFFVGAFGQYAGGWLADRYSLKKLLFAAVAVQIPLLAVATTATDWPLFVVGLSLGTIVLGIQPIADSLFGNHIPKAWHATAFGGRFLASLSIGALSVPSIGLIFDATGDFFWVFLMLAAVATAGIVAVAVLPREPRPRDTGPEGER